MAGLKSGLDIASTCQEGIPGLYLLLYLFFKASSLGKIKCRAGVPVGRYLSNCSPGMLMKE